MQLNWFRWIKSWPHASQLDEGFLSACSIDAALAYIRQGLELHTQQRGIFYGIRMDASLIGLMQLERKQYGRTIGIDYGLVPASRGKGIVTRACAVALQYIFDVWDMHRVELWIDVVNSKSRSVAERLGFSLEGIHRQLALYGKDWWGDIAVYALLKNEWKTLHK